MNSASSDLPHHLRILQERLQHPTDYEAAFHYFIEEFGGDKAFIQMGEPENLPANPTASASWRVKSRGENFFEHF